MEQAVVVEEQIAETSVALKKKKKNKPVDEAPVAALKVKKAKSEKKETEPADPKNQKASKDDKLTKFLVSMKKSLRKNVKKEAAEAGVSMNEYIVAAVVEKLGKDAV